MRRRIALELTGITGLAGLYLTILPHRPPGLDISLALVGLGLVGLSAHHTRERVWGRREPGGSGSQWQGAIAMLRFTGPLLVAFALFGAWDAYSVRHDWADVGGRLFSARVLTTLLLYIPWATIQQTLFQFYLLGRLRVLLPSAVPIGVAALNGVLFGTVHWPEWDVIMITVAGGFVWSYAYQRHRALWPIALSHALLGTAYFRWVRGNHAVRIFWLALGSHLTWS